jgi:hypothetical protein
MVTMNVGFGTPFQDQIDYLLNKLRLPTERWDDIQRSAHDRAFMVAGAVKADLLKDLHGAVVRAAQGGGLDAFRKDFRATVAKHGWTGWTGEGTKDGEAWRTKVIYQTNMAQSYWAGRYRQMSDPDVLKLRPYWRYIHSDGVAHPRLHHLAWHGLTLKADHPFWQTHFAPNGWGCRCRIEAVSKREGEASAAAGLDDLPPDWDAMDPKTDAAVGVDKGFDYAPGASANVPLRKMVQDKLITYPPAISSALSRDVTRYINATDPPSSFASDVLSGSKRTDPLWLGFVSDAVNISEVAGTDVTGFTLLLPADAVRHIQRSHGFDGGNQRPAEPGDFGKLAEVVNTADTLRAGGTARHEVPTVVATKRIGSETFRAVFEVLPGKKNRSLSLLSLVIKVGR